MASQIPWHKQAKALAEREMGGVDPSHLFTWPLARVLAVYFLESVGGVREVSLAEAAEILARKRREREERQTQG